MILIALGANLPSPYGTPEQTLRAALAEMDARGLKVVASSSVWKSAPVPVSDQPWYRNAVAETETGLSAKEVLAILHEIEADFGRVRAERNEARLLDLDLLAYHDEIFAGEFEVPHPRMQERAFVLLPLAEIAPGWRHPVSGAFVQDMLKSLPEGQQIEKSEKLAA